MIDKPTPQGFVQDAEEKLGKACALWEQATNDEELWQLRATRLNTYLIALRAWASAGGTGKRPRKPVFDPEGKE